MLERFSLATKVISGAGSINEIPTEAGRVTSGKVMIVTDQGLVKTGMIDKITAVLQNKNIECDVFADVQPNPDVKIAASCADQIKADNIGLVIAVGGGSSIDTAKAACMLATNGGDLRDYVGFERFRNNPVPLFAVPTTAGTGSEVTIVAVMSDEENNKKFTIGGQRLVPKVAFLDPELTLTLPARITAYTGVDALSHALESYTSLNAIQITDSLNVTAIKLIYDNLPVAVMQGGNMEARKNMLNAACYASMTCNSTYLGLVHAIASPLCAYYNIPHGTAVAIVLPAVMQFNLPACVEK
ncbi:MAG: iron-containing alcohol dehydrogenase, partial [Erysipelotrichaceae bacterium]|nr:iron-containing alcohol dehydrogenase [Erysipelotrichaceae bacterium]